MKRRSNAGIYILMLVIMLLVLTVGMIAVIGYGRMHQKLEEKEEELRQEAEATPEPTETPTPEPTTNPDDPAIQKAKLIASIREAVDRNHVQMVESLLRYTSQDGMVVPY